jgi:hypothetical protein
VAQFARPIQDVARGSWTTNVGGTANLWAAIDEQDADETDYIQSSLTANDTYEARLSSVEAALVRRLHILNYRTRKSAAAGNTRGVTVSLVHGTTVIASQSHPDLTIVWATLPLLLTRQQAAAITDSTDLRVRFAATGTTGGSAGNRRAVWASWAQLRVPDATDLLDDWRTRWGVPVEVTTLDELIAWLEPQAEGDPPDAVWLRRYNLAIAVWKLSAYRPMREQINAGTYPLPPHQTQQFAATKIAGKLTRFQTIADTLDTEDSA